MAETRCGFTRTSRTIKAEPDALYHAFVDPEALIQWLPPGEMTGEIHHFDARIGGGYRMSLFYPSSDRAHRGKTSEHEDSVTVRFVELVPGVKIVEAVTFDSLDPAFSGEMRMEVTFEPIEGGTDVTIVCSNIPAGIVPEDNDRGAAESLQKLANYIER